jgi:hypothetical protein
VTVRGRLEPGGEGAWKPFTLELEVREGWHVNANPPLLRFMVPTQVKAGENAVRGLRYPSGDRYEGRVSIQGEVEVSGAGGVSLSLTYQPCDEERCLPAVTREVTIR